MSHKGDIIIKTYTFTVVILNHQLLQGVCFGVSKINNSNILNGKDRTSFIFLKLPQSGTDVACTSINNYFWMNEYLTSIAQGKQTYFKNFFQVVTLQNTV